MYGSPEGAIIKLSIQFFRYTPLNCKARCLLTRHDVTYVTLHFCPEYIDLPGVCIQKFVMIHGILQ